MEKIISCNADDIVSKVQPLLDQGYKVKHMVAEKVAIAMIPASETRSYEKEKQVYGKIIVVLES